MWELAIKLLVIMIGIIATVFGAGHSIAYLQHPNDHAFKKMITAWAVLLLLCLIGLGLSIVNQFKIRHFNPNLKDQAARIAIGRRRAVTRAEFEKQQQKKAVLKPPEDSKLRDIGNKVIRKLGAEPGASAEPPSN